MKEILGYIIGIVLTFGIFIWFGSIMGIRFAEQIGKERYLNGKQKLVLKIFLISLISIGCCGVFSLAVLILNFPTDIILLPKSS